MGGTVAMDTWAAAAIVEVKACGAVERPTASAGVAGGAGGEARIAIVPAEEGAVVLAVPPCADKTDQTTSATASLKAAARAAHATTILAM